eukprot:1718274-Amphidinium_carterae.2
MAWFMIWDCCPWDIAQKSGSLKESSRSGKRIGQKHMQLVVPSYGLSQKGPTRFLLPFSWWWGCVGCVIRTKRATMVSARY